MKANTGKKVTDKNDEERVARATALFFEADRLEALAYGILDIEQKTEAVLSSFSDAKSRAAAKRAEAYKVWSGRKGREIGAVQVGQLNP